MDLVFQIVTIAAAYLLGSIPTAVWVGIIFFGLDIRKHGSGNAGATNTFRVLGIKAGIPVLLFDVFKGWLAVKLADFTGFFTPATDIYINFQILLGIAAVLGHIFPIYAGFKGGKGVATLLGLVLAIQLFPALLAMGIFCVCLLISRYVSLSSMLSGISFPFLVVFLFKIKILSLIIFSVVIAILLLFTHRKNIVRLIHGNESKAKLFRRKKP
ncbi:MAG: glycerol-3-phosphate 1-O-acyltransferase PlsY [Bacteroidia bacterium]|nr:glycerol-3-phosphate 1-O-acyltransferase PlsY [Bacteroidia bacterium]